MASSLTFSALREQGRTEGVCKMEQIGVGLALGRDMLGEYEWLNIFFMNSSDIYLSLRLVRMSDVRCLLSGRR